MRTTSLTVAIAALATLGTVALVPGIASGSSDRAGAQVAELRRTVAPYRDEARALADGFVRTDTCTASPAGGMGYHYVNPQRIMQPVDPEKPAILLYRDGKDGARELSGAEFFVPDADQDTRTDNDRPSLWGQPFNGPMLGHEPGMPVHYDLHVWTDEANPDGVFAPWNRRVTCS
ncbi:MAG: hypothetical protein WCD35_08555 [Mycobacteriales bacterium]